MFLSLIKRKTTPLTLIMLLLISVSSFTIPAQKVEAIVDSVPVQVRYNWWQIAWDTVAMPAVTQLGKNMARNLIENLFQNIVDWIDSGFQGNSAFISSMTNIYKTSADQAIGEYIFNNPDLKFLCSPFQLKIKLALGLTYQPFRRKINCTLSQVLGNVERAYDNFTHGGIMEGGWDDWIQITTVPKNDPKGAYLIAKADLDIKIGDKKLSDVTGPLNWSGGALDFKECTTQKYEAIISPTAGPQEEGLDPDSYNEVPVGAATTFRGSPLYQPPQDQWSGSADPTTGRGTFFTKTTCKTKTPGTVIAEKLKVTGTSPEFSAMLEESTAKGFDAVIAALSRRIATWARDKLANGLLGGRDNVPDYAAETQRRLDALQSSSTSATPSSGTYTTTPAGSYYDPAEIARRDSEQADLISRMDSEFSATRQRALSDSYYRVSGIETEEDAVRAFGISGGADSLDRAGIQSYIATEENNFSTYVLASTTLEVAKYEIASSSLCIQLSGLRTAALSADMLWSFIRNIDGDTEYGYSQYGIQRAPYTLPIISQYASITSQKLNSLYAIKDQITSATDQTTINNLTSQARAIIQGSTSTVSVSSDILGWLSRTSSYSQQPPRCAINPRVWLDLQP